MIKELSKVQEADEMSSLPPGFAYQEPEVTERAFKINMADDLEFSADSVLKYLVENGGKVSNHDLVKHFKKFLSGPDSQETKAIFKEYVNSVASMKVVDGVKYVLAKKRVYDGPANDELSNSSETDAKKCKLSEDTSGSSGILHSHSSPSILGMVPNKNSDTPVTPSVQPPSGVFWSSDLPPGHVPQPPPRRKHSMKGKENRGAKFEESIRQINEEKEFAASPRNEEIQEIVSPGSVKEKAHKLNKMASELDLTKPSAPARRRDHHEKTGYDEDACSVSTLDPRRKEWIIKSARADYQELVKLLREEPRLAHVKDHNKYTALHWAAKRGNLDVIKLIAGTHKVDANTRTSGGYTPLHLAAMFGREEIMEVLINTYGADPSIRDYSGKRALHYLPKNQAERFLTLFPKLTFPILLCGKVVSGKNDKDPSLVRMGSLNSKTKRGSVLSAGRALTRMKSWGSADSIPDRSVSIMPPPKTYPKKKKSRKYADIVGFSENWRGRSVDSDSDSASGAAS